MLMGGVQRPDAWIVYLQPSNRFQAGDSGSWAWQKSHLHTKKNLISPITWLYKTFCKSHDMIKIRKSIVNCLHTKILVNFVNELGNLTWSNLNAMLLAHKLASILKIKSQICESSLDSWMYLMKVSLNVWFIKLQCERKNIWIYVRQQQQ